MSEFQRSAACAAFLLLAFTGAVHAQNDNSALGFFQSNSTQSEPEKVEAGSAKLSARQSDGLKGARTGRTGAVSKQIASVSTGCLKPQLMGIIRGASSHFGSEAVITSGYRRSRHSYHGKCMAADVQISGVSPGTLARYFRAQPGVGGVGTYGHTRSVHVDVAPRQYSWHHGRRRVASL